MTQKQDMEAALRNSLKGEEKSVQERFERAETIIDGPKKEPKKKWTAKQTLRKKVIRDTFCMPKKDHDLIEELRQRAWDAGIRSNKSEIVRAGIKALRNLKKQELKEIFAELDKVTLGRPKS